MDTPFPLPVRHSRQRADRSRAAAQAEMLGRLTALEQRLDALADVVARIPKQYRGNGNGAHAVRQAHSSAATALRADVGERAPVRPPTQAELDILAAAALPVGTHDHHVIQAAFVRLARPVQAAPAIFGSNGPDIFWCAARAYGIDGERAHEIVGRCGSDWARALQELDDLHVPF